MALLYRIAGSLAAMSFCGAVFVIISYMSMPVLRKHPTSMIFYLSVSDLLFSLKFIVTALYPHSDKLEQHTFSCYLQAGWAQFWGLASISWNGMISLNLIINLHKQGFARTSNLSKFYHMFVWGLSIATTSIMFAAHDRIGESGDGTCWVEKWNDPYRLLFLVPLLVYFSVSISAVLLAFVRTSNGVMSDSSRRGVMLRMVSYVAVFLLCWAGPVVHRIYALAHHSHDPLALQIVDAAGVSIQGFANAMVWLTNPSFFTSFKSHVLEKYFGRFLPQSDEKHPILAGIEGQLTDSNHDINRLGQILRRNIITCILLGVQQSLRDLVVRNDVTQKSYGDTRMYQHDELYAEGEDSTGQTFEFIDYAPLVFAHIRQLSSITTEQYTSSMSPSNFLGKLSDQLAKFSDGRSNSFFIFSPDKKFILKTINDQEAQVLLKMLPSLHRYFSANPHSLITRFYGCHAVKVSHGELVHVVVMGNVFSSPMKIHECYDLKGSWVNRSAGKREDPSKLGMDLDLQRQLRLTAPIRAMFLEQVQKDSLFLCSVNIMDYSLLLGFHFNDRDTPVSNNNSSLPQGIEMNPIINMPDDSVTLDKLPGSHGLMQLASPDGLEIYCVGIIDVLQLYDRQKKMERFAKVYLLQKDGAGLSSMPPRPYAERFYEGMGRIVGVSKKL